MNKETSVADNNFFYWGDLLLKTIELKCKNCDASLELKENIAFCPYCGTKLVIDDESINVNYVYTKRDEARIRECERKEKIQLKKLENEENKDKRDTKIGIIVGIGVPFLIALIILLGLGINKWSAVSSGKISAGNYKDYVGEDYIIVVQQFEELGFENITTIDLDDSGVAFWKNGKVKSISIDGNSDFDSINYFYKDDKVIIKYH